MGLQRTPPTRMTPLPSVSPIPPPSPQQQQQLEQIQPIQEDLSIQLNDEGDRTAEADKTTISQVSDSRAFVNRHPGVMRTPPGGSSSHLPQEQAQSQHQQQQHQVKIQVDQHHSPQQQMIVEHVDERPIKSSLAPSPMTEHVDERPIRPAPTPSPIPERSHSNAISAQEVDIEMNVEDDKEAEAIAESLIENVGREEDDSNSMEIDQQQTLKSTEQSATGSQGQHPRQQQPQQQQNLSKESTSSTAGTSPNRQVPVTPSSKNQNVTKTPRSRRKTMEQSLPSPPKLLPLQHEEEFEYGRRYQLTMETLERAVKAGAQRWTIDQMRGCFPQLTKKYGKPMEDLYFSVSLSMREKILSESRRLMEHYKVGPSLKSIDEVDREAKNYQKSNPPDSEIGRLGRPDAWRPDISPEALVAATLLPIYDDAYSKLREEYLELHKDCQDRYKSIIEKQNLLYQLENGVADGVIELDKTIEILDNLPTEDMMLWTESVESKLNTRAPEQIQ
ncbi:uncharacterized protein L201_003973 [Kwoniella dendrophila CBS 6074]|uniref:Uncharacterized protein n=1 Tax=Kwoniella dendrophila CBS 6074 TaxID=1295534 RepID=A0AAX4JX04_9TREE